MKRTTTARRRTAGAGKVRLHNARRAAHKTAGSVHTARANPGIVKRFLGGAFNRPGWILPFPEFVEKVRAEMVRRHQHGSGPLEPELVDTLRVMYDEAAQAYRSGGPEAVDAALRGVRRNPLDLATIIGVGVLAGATQAVVQPWVTKHVFKVDAPPEPVMGVVGNPAGNARFYVDQDDWPLQQGHQWWAVYDSVTREKMNLKGRGQRPVYGTERLAQRAADRLNKDWAAGKIEVVSENPARKEVTDRALRYRANATPPPGPRRCAFCGAARVEVGHINGHEEDNAPANLIWTCRPCNVRCGNTLRAAGVGRLTRQYNPDAKGAQSLGQWIMAVNCMKGIQGEMTVPAAVAMIRATPPQDRSQFQAEAWRKRKRIYGKSGRQESIPF